MKKTLVPAALAALLLTACGSAATTTVAPGAGGPQVTGTGPVDTTLAIDATAAGDPALAAAYRDAALRDAEATITHGGHLHVIVFGKVADASELVLDTDVPTLHESDEMQRGEAEDGVRADLANGLDATLGLSAAAPQVAARVRASGASGSMWRGRCGRRSAACGRWCAAASAIRGRVPRRARR